AKSQRHHIFVKIRRINRNKGQVTIMGYEKDARRVLIWITIPLDREIARIANDMRIGHDARASYDEAGSNSAPDGADVPRRPVVGLHFSRGNSNEALFNFAVRLLGRGNHDGSWWCR